MDNQELVLVLSFIGTALISVVLGALIRGASIKEVIEEVKANKEQLNDWTGKLAAAVPDNALTMINNLAQNAQDISRFMLTAHFPGVPFASTLQEIAGVALDVADVVEDVTDGEKEPIGPFTGKGIPPSIAA